MTSRLRLRPPKDEVEDERERSIAAQLRLVAMEMLNGCVERHREHMERGALESAMQESCVAGEWFDRLTGRG